jgi:GntR family transcriptional regulator/MocR family aminotransferase
MARRVADAALLPIALDRGEGTPLHRQLYDQLRDLILSGRLSAGQRLPSTRTLARELSVSRNTITGAFDQLLAEGYIVGRVGAGSYVSDDLPEDALSARTTDGSANLRAHPRERGLSTRGRRLANLRKAGRGVTSAAFTPGLPDLDAFPFDVWSRLMSKAWRRPPRDLLANAEPAGYLPLRRAIATYLRAVRGVRCEAEQVIVVSGAQQAIGLAAHVLLDEGDEALMEEPGYAGVRGALTAAGAAQVCVPVDGEGMDIAWAERHAPDAKLACVAPSLQYPLGITMSLARRLKLLDWAQRRDGWILEDDYDSEYRYAGRPLAALQGLDHDGRVVYIGTFSKVMFPSLRIGYLVVPADLTDPFRFARTALDDHPSTAAQPALAAFMEDGHFAAHVRRMRKRYKDRQEALLESAHPRLDGAFTIEAAEAGMHLVARMTPTLSARMDDQTARRRAAEAGINVSALSTFYANSIGRQGLLLGYAAVREEEMPAAVARLAGALGI